MHVTDDPRVGTKLAGVHGALIGTQVADWGNANYFGCVRIC